MCAFLKKLLPARGNQALWVISFCSLFCGLMVWLTPWQMDDLAYGIPYRKEILGHSLSWRQVFEFVQWHWDCVNGRLGDKTLLFWLGMAPKWLFALVAAASCFSIYYFAGQMVFGTVREHQAGNILLSVALTFCLPWGTYMYITNMFLNYVMGLALAMPALCLFVRGGRASAARCLLAGLLGFLSGSWHEVYSVAVLPGMAAFLLLLREHPGRLRLSVLAGTVAGLAFILCTPGFWARVDGTVDSPLALLAGLLHPSQLHPDVLRNSVTGLGLNALFVPCTLAALCVKRWRRSVDRLTWCAVLMTGIMLVFTMTLYYHSVRGARVYFYFDGMAIAATAMLLRPLCGRVRRVAKLCTAAAALVLMAVHCAFVVTLQVRLTREHDEIIADYLASPEGTVYHDVHGNGLGPVFALRKARSGNFYSNQVKYLEDFYRGDGVQIQLMPPVLKDFDPVAAVRAGKLRRRGLTMVYEGHFVTRDTAVLSKREMWPLFRMAEGDTLMASTLVSRFRDVYGSEWACLSPDMRHLYDRRPVAIVKM